MFIIGLTSGPTLAAESAVGFRAEYSGDVSIHRAAVTESPAAHMLLLAPVVHGYADWFEFEAEFAVWSETETADTQAAVRNLSATLYPLDWLQFRLGAYEYRPGFGETMSPSSFFVAQDPQRLISVTESTEPLSTFFVQSTFYVPFGFAVVTAAYPLRNPTLVDASSRWFPDAAFPATIPWPLPPYERTRRSITVTTPARFVPAIEDIQLGLEIGVYLPFLELSIIGFRGADPAPAYTTKVVFPPGSVDVFDLELTAHPRTVYAAGLDLSVPIGAFRFWADTALYESRSFASEEISLETFETELREAPALETVLGAGVELPLAFLSALVEYRGVFPLLDDPSAASPFLSSAALANVRFQPLDRRLLIEETFAVSLEDGSVAFVTTAAFSPSDQMTFRLTVPAFAGGTDSELGQFAELLVLSWSLDLLF